jgi:hypothetical protein
VWEQLGQPDVDPRRRVPLGLLLVIPGRLGRILGRLHHPGLLDEGLGVLGHVVRLRDADQRLMTPLGGDVLLRPADVLVEIGVDPGLALLLLLLERAQPGADVPDSLVGDPGGGQVRDDRRPLVDLACAEQGQPFDPLLLLSFRADRLDRLRGLGRDVGQQRQQGQQ